MKPVGSGGEGRRGPLAGAGRALVARREGRGALGAARRGVVLDLHIVEAEDAGVGAREHDVAGREVDRVVGLALEVDGLALLVEGVETRLLHADRLGTVEGLDLGGLGRAVRVREAPGVRAEGGEQGDDQRAAVDGDARDLLRVRRELDARGRVDLRARVRREARDGRRAALVARDHELVLRGILSGGGVDGRELVELEVLGRRLHLEGAAAVLAEHGDLRLRVLLGVDLGLEERLARRVRVLDEPRRGLPDEAEGDGVVHLADGAVADDQRHLRALALGLRVDHDLADRQAIRRETGLVAGRAVRGLAVGLHVHGLTVHEGQVGRVGRVHEGGQLDRGQIREIELLELDRIHGISIPSLELLMHSSLLRTELETCRARLYAHHGLEAIAPPVDRELNLILPL